MLQKKRLKGLFDLYDIFPTEQSCIDHLEQVRWEGKVISPFDPASQVYKCAGNRYRCRTTGKSFNVKTGTIFEGTKISLRQWFMAIYLITCHKKGISSHQLARDIDITQKTAWFMLQRIRNGLHTKHFPRMLDGLVMIDETFVGGKNKNRHWNKKVPRCQGRSFVDKVPVLGLLQLGGELRAFVVKDTNIDSLFPVIFANVQRESILVTDDWRSYKNIRDFDYMHFKVDHSRGQYADGDITTNPVEGAWNLLKRSIIGIYHKTSKKHLQKYVDEFVFRYNTRRVTTDERLDLFLQMIGGKRMTYRQLVNG